MTIQVGDTYLVGHDCGGLKTCLFKELSSGKKIVSLLVFNLSCSAQYLPGLDKNKDLSSRPDIACA